MRAISDPPPRSALNAMLGSLSYWETAALLGPLSLWERVRVRADAGWQFPLTPALSRRERELLLLLGLLDLHKHKTLPGAFHKRRLQRIAHALIRRTARRQSIDDNINGRAGIRLSGR